MLTSRGDETDRIVGLEIGADDYLPKTFSTRELLARLRAVTRRTFISKSHKENTDEKDIIQRSGLRIELHSRRAIFDGAEIELTPIEFDLLAHMAKRPGRALNRDQLLDAVSGREYEVFDRSVDVHISSLRRKLKDDPKSPRFIKTVRNIGYMFLEERSDES